MQPDERRRGKIQQGISRARLLLKKNLGWLPGRPLAAERGSIRWWCLPVESRSAVILSVDRERLRRMEMTITKLRHRFPNALPKIVEDVDDWLGRMDHLLAMLKDAVHRHREMDVQSWISGDVLPRRWTERFPDLRNRHAPLRPFLDAALFLEVTGLRRPGVDVLDWVDENASSLLRLCEIPKVGSGDRALELQLLLSIVRGDMHPDLLSVLFECLADESIRSLPARDVCQYAEQLSVQLKRVADQQPPRTPKRPTHDSMGEAFYRLLTELARLEPKSRRRAGELLSQLVSSNFIAKARALTVHVEREESRLLGMLRRLSAVPAELPRSKVERKQLKQSAQAVVDESGRRHVASVRYAVGHAPMLSQRQSLAKTWIRFLGCLPVAEEDPRPVLFARWERMRVKHRDGERATGAFEHILTRLCRLFGRRGVNRVLLSHWERYCRSNERGESEFVEDLLDEDIGRVTETRTIRLLEGVLYERGLSVETDLLCSLVEFVKATPDDRRAAGLVSALAGREDRYYLENEIRAALSVTDDDTTAAEILRVLDDAPDLVGPVALLGSRIHDDRLRRIVVRAILEKDKKLLLRLEACTQLVADLGFSLPGLPDTAASIAWLDRYPAALHEALRELSRVTEDAEEIADGLLSGDFPEEGRLRREIAGLHERLKLTDDRKTRQRLGKRLDNLKGRIAVPPAVTPQRLANLTRRVWGRVDHEVVGRYLRDGYDLAAEQLLSVYGMDRLPEELFQPPHDRLLSGVLQLKGSAKKLGLRLLLFRFSGAASDFSSEPKNVAFREKLEAKGINMEPWLSDAFELQASTRNDEPYRLFFTREVLDYLMMGFHFDTCLSPGSCNFFSTIANAVDVNKQVVYGKTASGRIIGRCLLTLSGQGAILTYHRYSHDPSDRFSDAVDEFARRLAQAMNTHLATSGQVPTLVANDWYDDGAVRTESTLDLQSAEGVVRTLLRTSEPFHVVDALREVMGTDQAVKSVLGSLLFVEEFTKRRAIVGPFVDAYGFDGDLTFHQRFRLAILARAAGLAESAEAILVSLRPNSLPVRLKRSDCESCRAFHWIGSYREVFDLLIDYSPTLALRTIRRTRPRDVRRDTDERQPERRHALARAHRLLGRDRLATELASKDSPA